MLSVEGCRQILGSLALGKSDDEIVRIREHAMEHARIVVRACLRRRHGVDSPSARMETRACDVRAGRSPRGVKE
jgi:hypothetical protein